MDGDRSLRRKDVWQRFRHQVDVPARDLEPPEEELSERRPVRACPRRASVILVQGFGRFGPFGPRAAELERSDMTSRQDWGVVLWLPLVCFGLYEAMRLGVEQLRAGKPPVALALVVWAVCAWAVVTLYLPMAWDRYQLPIQSGNALLAAVGMQSPVGSCSPRLRVRGANSRGLDACGTSCASLPAGSSSSCWEATHSSGTRATGIRRAG